MAKKKPKLTPNQALWGREYKLLLRRIVKWQKQGLLYGGAIPNKPKRIQQKHIQELRDINLRRLGKSGKEEMRRNYQQWQEQNQQLEEDIYDDGRPHVSEPVKTEAQMDEWLEETFDEIVNPSLIEREREGAKDVLRGILDDAKQRLGVKGMYNYFQKPGVVSRLNNEAEKYVNSYKRKDGTDTGDAPLSAFARILNLDRPLTQEQNEQLTMFGSLDFDFADTDYGE